MSNGDITTGLVETTNGTETSKKARKAAVNRRPKSSTRKRSAPKRNSGPRTQKKNKVGKASTVQGNRRTRAIRSFPSGTFQEALELALAIQKFSSGEEIRRLTLFDELGKSPESGPSRQMIVNASRYGLITGGYQSETLALTPDGRVATDQDAPERDRARARVKLAIQDIPPFNAVYGRFVNNKLPSRAVLADAMRDAGVSKELAEEAVDTFIVNAQFVGILRTLSGAERFVTVEHLLVRLSRF